MAKFEEIMEEMKNMSQEEREEKIKEVKSICKNYCGNCPTYEGTGESDLGFCLIGKSDIIRDEKKCLCPTCPITVEMGLKWSFYCTRGSGKEQKESEL